MRSTPPHPAGAGEPWQPSKLYYHHSFHRERTQALHDEMIVRGLTSPYEEPASPDVRLRTDNTDLPACVAKLVASLRERGFVA